MSDEQPPSWARDQPGWAPEQPPAYPPYAAPYTPTGAPAPPFAPQPGAPGWGPAPPGFAPPPAAARPGIIPLRPLGLGEILDGAISALRTHWQVMLGLSLLVAVVTQVLTVPITWLLLRDSADSAFSIDQPTSTEQDVAFAASSLGAAAVQVLVSLVAVLILTGILTAAVSRAVLGSPINVRDSWAQARPRIPALIGVTLLIGVLLLGLTVVTMAPGALLAVLDAPTPVVALTFTVGSLALVGLAVYLYTALALAPAALVLEKTGVVASLRRSRSLVQGAWWRTFGILVLVSVIAGVIGNILTVPFVAVTLGVAFLQDGGDALNIYAIVPLIITALGTIFASAVTWPFTAVSTALIYIDRRMRREALDVELTRVVNASAPGAAPGPPPHR